MYDEEKGHKVTLETALSSSLLDGSEGRLMSTNGAVALDEAARNNKIQVPLTVKDSVDLGWVGEDNICKDPITGDNLSILEAVGRGFIDYELKSVRDVKNEVYVSLGDALSKAIIKPDGRFTDTLTGESMSLADAVKKGFLTSVSQKTIFDIEGIKNPATGDYINFNEAMDLRIIDKNNSTFFDKKTLTRMTLAEAVDKDYIQSQLLDMLQKPIGIKQESGVFVSSHLAALGDGGVGAAAHEGSAPPRPCNESSGSTSPPRCGATTLLNRATYIPQSHV